MSDTMIDRVCIRCQSTFSVRLAEVKRGKGKLCGIKCRGLARKEPAADRLWRKLDKISSPHGCWLWTAKPHPAGYGRVMTGGTGIFAHRLAWELLKGPVPDGMEFRNNCPGGGNPLCANPSHWLLVPEKFPEVARICKHCGKEFLASQAYIDKGWAVYCSIPCTRIGAGLERRKSAEARFWKRVKKTDSCWIWIGGTCSKGYGTLMLASYADNETPTRETASTHRYSWELHRGPIPEGLQVLHDCPDGDNPACVNPDHLWLGTNDENMADKVKKDRQTRGILVPHAVLTDDLVRDLRARYSAGETLQELWLTHQHISKTTIESAVKGQSWKHVTMS